MMENTSERIVRIMMENDFFSRWLGIETIETGAGKSKLRMTVRKEMLNGFGIAHGGITYSLADSALAFASNGYGRKAVSIETSVSHIEAVKENDILFAEASELSRNDKIGIYSVKIKNQNDVAVAFFKGTVYLKQSSWEK